MWMLQSVKKTRKDLNSRIKLSLSAKTYTVKFFQNDLYWDKVTLIWTSELLFISQSEDYQDKLVLKEKCEKVERTHGIV